MFRVIVVFRLFPGLFPGLRRGLFPPLLHRAVNQLIDIFFGGIKGLE